MKAGSANLGSCIVTAAKLPGILWGLCIAKNMRLELDSFCMYQFIIQGGPDMHIHAPLVRDIRNFLDDNDWNVEVGHTYREADSCADKLAKSGHNFRLGVKFFERLPP